MQDYTPNINNIFKDLIDGGDEIKSEETKSEQPEPEQPDTQELTSNKIEKWSPNQLNSTQKRIISYAFKNGQLWIPYIISADEFDNQIKKWKETAKESGTQDAQINLSTDDQSISKRGFVYGFNEKSAQFHNVYINGNYKVSNKYAYIDPGQVVLNILSSNDNIYLNNVSRADLRFEIESKRTLSKDEQDDQTPQPRLTDTEYILGKIHNIPITIKPKELIDIERLNSLCTFAPTIAHILSHALFSFYAKTGKTISASKLLPFDLHNF